MKDMKRRSVNIIAAKAPCDTTIGSDSLSNSRKVVRERLLTAYLCFGGYRILNLKY